VVTTVCPFLVVICGGLWLQLRQDQANALDDALDQAQLFAAQVDEHIGNLEHLMMGLSRAVSTRFADTSANDALLRQAKKEMPDFISEIFLFAPDGSIIGVSWNENIRNNVSERAFRRVLAGGHLAIGDVIYTRFSQQWVVTLASRVEDQNARLRAVIAGLPNKLSLQKVLGRLLAREGAKQPIAVAISTASGMSPTRSAIRSTISFWSTSVNALSKRPRTAPRSRCSGSAATNLSWSRRNAAAPSGTRNSDARRVYRKSRDQCHWARCRPLDHSHRLPESRCLARDGAVAGANWHQCFC